MSVTETYSFGEWCRKQRERLRLTQKELAASVHCSTATIKKIEGDERRPSPELAELLAVALQVPQSDQAIFIAVARGERTVELLWHVPDGPTGPVIRAPAPSLLPRTGTPFIGRTDELTAIGQRLANPECRLLTLTGPGGIGKTRLALAAAQAQQAAFPDGVAFLPLATVIDAQSIPDAIARNLHLSPGEPPADQVLVFARRRVILLVLDNCEQIEGDLSWLSDLLAQAPGLKLLATSRERLHLREEWVYVVPGLAQAAALFIKTAQRVMQDFDAEREQAAVLRICRLVENLPLAVELAASWTPLMPSIQIAEYIQRDVSLLAADVRDAPERHHSIQAVFDHSWKLLSAAEQNALMSLSVFRGGWQSEEALPVSGADLLMLRRLVEKSLVRAGENGRYDLHELIRQYAAQKLIQAGLESEARQRHCRAVLALAARLDAQHKEFGAEGIAALARFDQERENIRAALDWSLTSGQIEMALQMIYHLNFYWFRRGFLQEGAIWNSRAIQQAGEGDSSLLCQVMSLGAGFIFYQQRYGEAESLSLRALAMADRLGDPEAQIMAHLTYVFASASIEEALNGIQAGIDLIEKTGILPQLLPLLTVGAATWLHSSGRLAEAWEYYRRGLAQYQELGAVDLMSGPLDRMGELALQEGRIQEAYDLTLKGITASRAADFNVAFGTWESTHLGLIQLYLGDIEQAEQSLKESLQLLEDGRHNTGGKLEVLSFLSEAALARGDLKAAADYLQASLNSCALIYRELQATRKLESTPDALPIDLTGYCARTALLAAAQGDSVRALTLSSIANSLSFQSGQQMIPQLQAKLNEQTAGIRSQLSEQSFSAAWDAGQKMSLTETFAYLLAGRTNP